jgi:hypothetical protein
MYFAQQILRNLKIKEPALAQINIIDCKNLVLIA